MGDICCSPHQKTEYGYGYPYTPYPQRRKTRKSLEMLI